LVIELRRAILLTNFLLYLTDNLKMSQAPHMDFVPALIIVDFQEDFCPPNGSLAVANGRSIAPTINELLDLPFVIKVATKDWHPPDHISFASNHLPPNNVPYKSTVTISNPLGGDETETTLLWPDHCVQGTKGAELVPELDVSKVDVIIEKGMDKRVEMYSAFSAPFRNPPVAQSRLTQVLKDAGATHVYVVGLALDYCVKFTAMDAAQEGFQTFVILSATAAVDPNDECEGKVRSELNDVGATLVKSTTSEQVKWVKA
jgi:nicotinamidase-related amidase